jgi:hypothetical protein
VSIEIVNLVPKSVSMAQYPQDFVGCNYHNGEKFLTAIDHFGSRCGCGSVRMPSCEDIAMRLRGSYAPQILDATGAGKYN